LVTIIIIELKKRKRERETKNAIRTEGKKNEEYFSPFLSAPLLAIEFCAFGE